jgi:flavin reductase (DIM6/NTAB) family NADH-FMN oxidoreductase RutF
MEILLQEISAQERYKLLTALVIPRPIALVTTRNANGTHNAAPFSFFNVVSEEPAIVVLGFGARGGEGKKDTPRNIEKTGEFVVNMVDRELVSSMRMCAADFPYGESEVDAAGLTLEPSRAVAVNRIRQSPASLECRLFSELQLSPKRLLVLGEIMCIHIKDEAFDPNTMRIVPEHYDPLGRLYGTTYAWMRERFSMPLHTYEELKRLGKGQQKIRS